MRITKEEAFSLLRGWRKDNVPLHLMVSANAVTLNVFPALPRMISDECFHLAWSVHEAQSGEIFVWPDGEAEYTLTSPHSAQSPIKLSVDFEIQDCLTIVSGNTLLSLLKFSIPES